MSLETLNPKPVSEARRAAARANGAKSKGPVTPEGKAKSSLNAVTHCLTANALVLTTESKEKYDALLAAYRDECDPQGQIENDLVEEVVSAKWLQRRAMAMITALLDTTMDRMDHEVAAEFETIDNAARTALAFARQVDQGGTLALLQRYLARHTRDYHRALDKIMEIQTRRRGREGAPINDSSPVEPVQDDPIPALEERMQNEPNEPAAAAEPAPVAAPPSHKVPGATMQNSQNSNLQNEPKPAFVEGTDDRIAC